MGSWVSHIGRFAWRVGRDFFLRNHGLVITSAVAFHLMLSLVPLCAVLLTVSSHFADEQRILEWIQREVSLIAPGFVPMLTTALGDFLRVREVAGWVGLVVLLFFSSTGFRVLEDAFAIIHHRQLPTLRRKFWVSVLLPFLFITVISVGLIGIALVQAWFDSYGSSFLSGRHSARVIHGIGVAGLIVLFTMFYMIMPVAKISFRRGLVGGITAAILWEITRQLLVAYYARISSVNLIYGSMATMVVGLLTLEAIALIVLLGAQVIAELQRNANLGLPWHVDPGDDSESG